MVIHPFTTDELASVWGISRPSTTREMEALREKLEMTLIPNARKLTRSGRRDRVSRAAMSLMIRGGLLAHAYPRRFEGWFQKLLAEYGTD